MVIFELFNNKINTRFILSYKCLFEVEKERLKTEEESLRLSEKKGQLNKSLRDTELELEDCRKTVEVK